MAPKNYNKLPRDIKQLNVSQIQNHVEEDAISEILL